MIIHVHIARIGGRWDIVHGHTEMGHRYKERNLQNTQKWYFSNPTKVIVYPPKSSKRDNSTYMYLELLN